MKLCQEYGRLFFFRTWCIATITFDLSNFLESLQVNAGEKNFCKLLELDILLTDGIAFLSLNIQCQTTELLLHIQNC